MSIQGRNGTTYKESKGSKDAKVLDGQYRLQHAGEGITHGKR